MKIMAATLLVVSAGLIAGCGGNLEEAEASPEPGSSSSSSSSTTSSSSSSGGGYSQATCNMGTPENWPCSWSSPDGSMGGCSHGAGCGWTYPVTGSSSSSGLAGSSSSTTSSTTSSGWAGSTSSTSTSSSSSSGHGGASSTSSSGYLACEYSIYENTFDADSEPQLAPTEANAVLASANVADEAWFESQGWRSISAAHAQSSTSSGGGFVVSNPADSFRLDEETGLTHKMLQIAGTEPLHRYAVSAEVRAADSGDTVDFLAEIRGRLPYQLPDGSSLYGYYAQTVLEAEQLTDEWTTLTGVYNTTDAYGYFYMDSASGPFMYRNLRVESDGELTPPPDFSQLQAALDNLPADWQRDVEPVLYDVASNYAFLSETIIHGGGAACDAGAINGLRFPLHINPAVPRYRLKLALEITGPTAGSVSVDLYGEVERGREVIAPEVSQLIYKNSVFAADVEPGQMLEISEAFDYQPFNAMRAYVLSDEVEFLVHSVELERIYPDVSTDEGGEE